MATLVKYGRLIDNFGYQRPNNPREMEPYDAFNEEYAHKLKFTVIDHNVDRLSVSGHYNQNMQDGVKMGGAGYADVIGSALSMIKQGKDLYNAYGSESATRVKNIYGKYINKHPNYRPSYVGEKHILDPYSGAMMNYCGPHTQLDKRLARGDPPLDGAGGVDAQCRKHDIAYRDAQNFAQIRFADKKMVSNVSGSSGKPILKGIVNTAMRAKMKAEDLGLLRKDAFISPNENPVAENPPKIGSGIKKPRDPMRNLRNKMYKKSKKERINRKLTNALKRYY